MARRRPAGDRAPEESPELILAGRAWVRSRLQPVEVAIGADGRILSVGKTRGGGPRHDVGDAILLPAATDLHVHFREPGGPADAETIPTGTLQAALGGVTLVGEMPNTAPPVVDEEALEEKRRLVQGRAAVDVVLYGSPTRPAALARLARRAGALKLYLSPTTGIPQVPTAGELPGLLRRVAATGLPLAVHAEDPDRFDDRRVPRTLTDWNAHRPLASEEAAVEHLAPVPPALRLHVAHVTSASVAARLRELGASFEATPHHLLLAERPVTDTRRKVNPPLRSEATRAGLWEAFRQGQVPVLASDHAPHASEAKDRPFEKAPSGMPGVETMLPLLLARVRAGSLELPVLLAAAADRPARIFGQPLGRIAPGHRANLLVVDFRSRSRIAARKLHAPAGWTAFEGWEAIFPREHYRDGQRIVADGEYVGRPDGRVVRPEFAPGEPGSPG